MYPVAYQNWLKQIPDHFPSIQKVQWSNDKLKLLKPVLAVRRKWTRELLGKWCVLTGRTLIFLFYLMEDYSAIIGHYHKRWLQLPLSLINGFNSRTSWICDFCLFPFLKYWFALLSKLSCYFEMGWISYHNTDENRLRCTAKL